MSSLLVSEEKGDVCPLLFFVYCFPAHHNLPSVPNSIMCFPASDLFNDNENTICLEDRSEVWIIKNYRRLSERQKGRIEGYIKALLDQTGRNDFQSE